ncbi:glycoside hydrolase family 13 protein [Eubacterium sp. MSJ-33]|uniref:glycoside hydrolase family 13 protein n=1 Tax=Eubacterium sp. MSJ-33 TaxID=2841528 RepID=UPI001C74E7B9|nr:glycoside hydrolase family 13 protein [Eubacterium sp. MSJ-33]QWT52511.1 glycoside hydrolase family 13 protein [Eubacterium sp. MSJ-33]
MVENQRQALKVLQYVYNTKTALNFGALFADGTDSYRHPAELSIGDSVVLRFRTGRNNVDAVYLVYNGERCKMQVERSDDLFDYYAYTISEVTADIDYYYMVLAGNVTCYYNKLGTQKDLNPDYNFQIAPGFSVPKWARGAVFYQIFVDRFYNGDPSNDVEDNEYCYIGEGTRKVRDWFKYPDNMDVRSFYGGDLQGVKDKLDYLQGLGVDVIYLNPIFVSPSNHKYDIQDYDYVDPHFGKIVKDGGECLPEGCKVNKEASKYIMRVTDKANLEASNELFAQLVEEIHKRGMRVILDGVFNHCGSFNKWLDRECIYENQEGYEKGAYVDYESPYRSFFKFQDPWQWPYNGTYNGWWGHDTLPKLNYEESEKLYEYIMRIGEKWVSPPYNVDGWRLDVAADLGYTEEFNHRFWRDFRSRVKKANPDALILAEHYGDPKAWLLGDQWDTVMNYDAFMEPITWFLTGVEKHSDEFRGDLLGNPDAFTGALRHHMSRFNQNSLEIAMNELSNHDHSRFLTRTNRRVGRIHTMGPEAAGENINKGVFREAVVFQMTWPGAPTIYYGDEAGLCGWTDPDNRRGYPWGREDQELIQFHRDIIKVHKESEALMKGSVMFLHGEYKVVSYGRFLPGEAVVVILNNDYEPHELNLHVRRLGVQDAAVMKTCITTTESGYQLDETEYVVANNKLKIMVGPISAVVLKYTEAQ